MDNLISSVWLNVNSACNLDCKWCYNKASLQSGHTMSLSMAKSIVDLMNQCGANKYCLIGGEPTLYKALFELIQKISDTGAVSTLLTNAIKLVDYEYCLALKRAGLNGVNVSIKAIDSDSMKQLTGYPNVDYLSIVVKNLKKVGLSNCASVVVSKYTCKDICKICDFLVNLGFDSIILSFCQPIMCNNKNFILEKETLEDTVMVLKEFFNNYERLDAITDGRITGCGPLPICLYPKDVFKKMLRDNQVDNGCIILSRKGIVFNPKGEVCICNHLQEFSIGQFGLNFFDKASFESFWKSETVQNAFDLLSTIPKEDCLKCNKYKFCGGSCPLRWFQYSIDELDDAMKEEGIL